MFEFFKIFLGVTLVAAGGLGLTFLILYSAILYPLITTGALVFGTLLAISFTIWSEIR